jgi:putative phage-type endonuclease
MRAVGIGGTHVGTICGFSKWSSPMSLWARKTKRVVEPIERNEAMEWGNRLEPVVIDKFADTHPDYKIYRDTGMWKHKDREWQIANPDAIYEKPDGTFGVLEVKTARYEEDWQSRPYGKYKVPLAYMAQVQWYLQVFGLKEATIVALISGSKYIEIEVAADPFEQEVNLARVELFRKHLLDDTQPDFDGADKTLETIRKLNPDIEDTECELGDLGVHYFNAVEDYEKATATLNEMKSRVIDAMGKSKRGLVYTEHMVSRQSGRGGNPPFLVNKRGK